MFVGHYAAALGARAFQPALPLWVLFVAVQFVDFLWAVLVMVGIERVEIIPEYTAASPLRLYHMPYTHSLFAAVLWSVIVGGFFALLSRYEKRVMAGLILGLAVFSHWIADLLVHTPDLPLFYGDPKFGFGLWRYFWISQSIEIGVLALGTLIYVLVTRPASFLGRFTPWMLLGALIAIQAISHIPPAEPLPPRIFAAQALAVYVIISLMAFGVDRTRVAR